MSDKSIRIDNPAHARSSDVAYPATPDARNYARLSYKNKRYHLGKYDSPESYATYAIWRATIDRTGEAPELATIRSHVQAFLANEPAKQPVYTRKWFAGSLIVSAFLVAFSIVSASQIISSRSHAKVDGIAMSENEILQVRNTRAYFDKQAARRASPESVATRALLLKKLELEGSASLPIPEIPEDIRHFAKPAFPDLPSRDVSRNASGGYAGEGGSDAIN